MPPVALFDDLPNTLFRMTVTLGPAGMPGVKTALGDKDSMVRSGAATALGLMEPRPKEAVPLLRSALADPEWDVRCAAAESLGNMGAAATSAVPDLQKMLASPYSTDCSSAAQALYKIR